MSNVVADLRAKAEKFRAAATALDEHANTVEKGLAEVESLLGGSLEDIAGSVAPKQETPAPEGKKRGRPAGSTNQKTPTGDGSRPRNEMTLKSLIHQILKEKRSGLELKDIVAECVNRGYKSTGAKFSNVVYQNLYQMLKTDNTVEKDDNKKYRLVKAA